MKTAASDSEIAWSIVQSLQTGECASVFICDNRVECCADWTDWNVETFRGDTVIDALKKAYERMTGHVFTGRTVRARA